MSNADKIGGLPFLSWIWNLEPWSAAFTVFLADFGIVCLLMMAEGRSPWRRQHYKSFLYGDSIFLPLYAAMVSIILARAHVVQNLTASTGYHVGLLLLAALASFVIEILAVVYGEFTRAQEFSPSKLWHTFILVIMVYWCVSPLPAVLTTHAPFWPFVMAMIGLLGWAGMLVVDIKSTKPWDAHLEGTYSPWNWYVRPR